MSFDPDRAERDGKVVVNKDLRGGNKLHEGQQVEFIMCRGDQSVIGIDGKCIDVVHNSHRSNLPREHDIMRVFDEAVGNLKRTAWTSDDYRQALSAALNRDPVHRLEAEHGVKVVELKEGQWFGVGTHRRYWRRHSERRHAVCESIIDEPDPDDKGFPTPRSCAEAILKELEKGGE